MANDENPTVETRIEPDVWEAIADGVNEVGHGEGVFKFTPDGFEVTCVDPANVALIRQRVDGDAFADYQVDAEFETGVDTDTFDDLLDIIDDGIVSFRWDWDRYAFVVESTEVEYELTGIQPDAVNSVAQKIPLVKDDDELPDGKTYDVSVRVPVAGIERATELCELNGSLATFRVGGDDPVFNIEGRGDDDRSTVRLHEDDDFEWVDPAPPEEHSTNQSNDYLSDLVDLMSDGVVDLTTGFELPLHIWDTREGVIDTKILQAPRIDSSK